MPDTLVQDWLPRYPIQLPFLHKARTPGPTRVGVGWTRNLSEGGACVEVGETLQPRMPLRFFLRMDRGAIEAEAKVVWADEFTPAGGGVLHGITFTRLAPNHLRALTDLLRFQWGMRDGGFRFPLDFAITCHPREPAKPPLLGRIGDLSREGVLLRLAQSLLPGTPLELILHTARGALTVEGVIVWGEPTERRAPGKPICHGVRFTSLSWTVSLALGLVLTAPPEALPSHRLLERGVPNHRYDVRNWVGQTAPVRPPASAIPRPRRRDR